MSNRVLAAAVLMIATLVFLSGCSSKPSEEVKLGGIALTEVLQGLLDRTAQTLSSVRDLSSARAAVDPLNLINQDFDDLIFHIPKLSPEGQAEMADAARKAMPSLQDTVRRINGSPPMAEILGAQMNTMYEKLGLIASGNVTEEAQE